MKKFLSICAVATFPAVALAARDLSTVDGWKAFLWQIAQWMVDFFWIAAVAYVIYVAYLFVASGGNSEKVTEARRHLVYALVGMAVALLATTLPTLVCSTLGICAAPAASSSSPAATGPTPTSQSGVPTIPTAEQANPGSPTPTYH